MTGQSYIKAVQELLSSAPTHAWGSTCNNREDRQDSPSMDKDTTMYTYEKGDWHEFLVLLPRFINGRLRWLVPAWRLTSERRTQGKDGTWLYYLPKTQYQLEVPCPV